MPIYEYRCEQCGATRELILKPGEEARPTCTGCRRRMKRMISPTAFILKGAGWFVTDYPSQDRRKGMEAEKEKAPAGEKTPGKDAGTAGAGKPAGAAAPAPKSAATQTSGEKAGKRKGRGRS